MAAEIKCDLYGKSRSSDNSAWHNCREAQILCCKRGLRSCLRRIWNMIV